MKVAPPLTAVILTGWIVSCSPYSDDEAPPTPPTDVAQNQGATTETPADGEMSKPEDPADQGDTMKEKKQEQITETVEDPAPPKVDPKPSVPVARRVPGRDGFVFSPYNNKMINVKDFASGTMVADPTYPPSEKKYFRVP